MNYDLSSSENTPLISRPCCSATSTTPDCQSTAAPTTYPTMHCWSCTTSWSLTSPPTPPRWPLNFTIFSNPVITVFQWPVLKLQWICLHLGENGYSIFCCQYTCRNDCNVRVLWGIVCRLMIDIKIHLTWGCKVRKYEQQWSGLNTFLLYLSSFLSLSLRSVSCLWGSWVTLKQSWLSLLR